jgi:hypothetical protein
MASGRGADSGNRAPATLTATDLVAGLPVVVLAVVATSSLVWAHLGAHSLPAVLLTSSLLLGLLVVVVARRAPRVVGDRWGVAAVLGCGLVGAVLFLPGFSYGVGDKDPGVYTAHAVQIAREGSYAFTDPVLAHPTLPVVEPFEQARHPGIWIADRESGRIVPQFFHLWPALLATAYDVAGYGGLTATTPLVAVFAVMALTGVLRRVGGVVAAVTGGLLLATNMLQVWQAKFPSTEALAQALFVGTLLWVVVAVRERWGPAAFLAGALTGVSFLARADAWLLVMLAAGVLGAVWAARRADALVAWGAAGLGVVLPYCLVQAYGTAHRYTLDNHVPDLAPTLVLLGVVVAGSVAARVVLRRPVDALLGLFARRRAQVVAGLAVCAACLLLLVLGFLRTRLFGLDYMTVEGQGRLRSYDEQNLRRLAWFVTHATFALAGLGVAVVALRRWRTDAWAVVLPTLLLAPVFLWQANVAVRLMWWGRRYVPHVLPGLFVLVALAVAFGAAYTWRGRRVLLVPSLVAPAALVAVFLGQSLPLRSHDEWHGSFGIVERIAATSGDARGVYLWEPGPCCGTAAMLFAGPVWLRGEVSAMLPDSAAEQAAYLAAYRAAFPGEPVFVVWEGPDPLPEALRAAGLTEVTRLRGTLPMWRESNDRRPDSARTLTYDVTVYRVP